MNMKAAASLTGSLLARKGAAYPAAYSAPSTAPSAASTESDGESQPQRAYNDPRVIASAPPQPTQAPAPATDAPQLQDGQFGSESPDGPAPGAAAPAPMSVEGSDQELSIPQAMDKMGRVRLSVRLDPDRYLRVKMASARTRWSAQDIVIEALDRYFGNSAGGSETDQSDADTSGDDEDNVN